jgi:hypothetical protein
MVRYPHLPLSLLKPSSEARWEFGMGELETMTLFTRQKSIPVMHINLIEFNT